MANSKPATWLFLLIVGAGIWTDLFQLIRGGWGGTNLLFAVSCALLVASLPAFVCNRTTLIKWTTISGMGLAVIGTIVG